MAAVTDHPCFSQPENPSMRLWRYMDFTKFVSLISSRSLYLCRADLFTDPFEGSYSKANVELRPHVYSNIQGDSYQLMMQQMTGFSRWAREWTYINCWHANEHESAAMWDLYAKTNEAVAIETNYEILKNVLPENTLLGLVNYIDYEREWLPEGNTLYPFTHKRKSFEHEKEVRIVMQNFPTTDDGIMIGTKNPNHGRSIEIDLNELITCIHVSPTAPEWLVNLTKEISKKYQIEANIRKSDLYSEPVF